jgi:hypothetical protein
MFSFHVRQKSCVMKTLQNGVIEHHQLQETSRLLDIRGSGETQLIKGKRGTEYDTVRIPNN